MKIVAPLIISIALPFIITVASIVFFAGCGGEGGGMAPDQRTRSGTVPAVGTSGHAIKQGDGKVGEPIADGVQDAHAPVTAPDEMEEAARCRGEDGCSGDSWNAPLVWPRGKARPERCIHWNFHRWLAHAPRSAGNPLEMRGSTAPIR